MSGHIALLLTFNNLTKCFELKSGKMKKFQPIELLLKRKRMKDRELHTNRVFLIEPILLCLGVAKRHYREADDICEDELWLPFSSLMTFYQLNSSLCLIDSLCCTMLFFELV